MILPSTNHPINCGLASSTFSGTFSKRSGLGGYTLNAAQNQRILSSDSTSIITVQDRVLQRNVGSSWVSDFIVSSTSQIPGLFQKITLTSLNTNILYQQTPNSSLFTYAGDGTCFIQGVSEDGEIVTTKVQTSSGSPLTIDIFQNWAAGSLADHCSSQINSLIANKNQLNVFTVANGANFVRNPNCWASSVDLSCASPWNFNANDRRKYPGNVMAGTLVSPRHVIFCRHSDFYPIVGSTMWFVSQNNIVITKTIQSLTALSGDYADIVVGTLDSEVPSIIKYAKILPSNYSSYLPLSNLFCYIPILYLNQFEQASIMGLVGLDSQINGIQLILHNQSGLYKPNISTYINFYNLWRFW